MQARRELAPLFDLQPRDAYVRAELDQAGKD